ncbi:MAG: hypothetical protein IID44_10700 [Planctomycetes bacterium]|nr:hypothetical protein [Planctomycetota bacterium]
MRRFFWLLPLLVLPLVGWRLIDARDEAIPGPGPQPVCDNPSVLNTIGLLGNRSCAASACHGSVQPDRQLYNLNSSNIGRNEFIVWLEQDPHAGAFETLSNKTSLQMFERLGVMQSGKVTAPERYRVLLRRCVACHSPDLHDDLGEKEIAAKLSGPNPLVGEGVGCEACHGAAKEWRARHYKRDWDDLDTAASVRLGMVDTANLMVRARRCAQCHVGGPGLDVDHDLIAAGHPALKFELAGYLDRLPKHWNDTRERKGRKSHELQLWAAGQLAASEASLHLLETRAAAAEERRAGSSLAELAEYNCYACHHDLGTPSWRQQRGYTNRRPGAMPWSNWAHAMPRLLAEHAKTDEFTTLLNDLQNTMESGPAPNAAKVRQQAAAARLALCRLMNATERTGIDPTRLQQSLAGLAAPNRRSAVVADWDTATQFYLALVAADVSYRDDRGGDPDPQDAAITARLLELRERLRFPRQTDSPADFRGTLKDTLKDGSSRQEIQQHILSIIKEQSRRIEAAR